MGLPPPCIAHGANIPVVFLVLGYINRIIGILRLNSSSKIYTSESVFVSRHLINRQSVLFLAATFKNTVKLARTHQECVFDSRPRTSDYGGRRFGVDAEIE